MYLDYLCGGSSKMPRGSSGFSFSSNPSWLIADLSFNVKIYPEEGVIGLRTSFVCNEERDYYVAFFT